MCNHSKVPDMRDAKQVTKELIELMENLSPDERLEVFSDIEDIYCQHCGWEQPKGSRPCQCWNDE